MPVMVLAGGSQPATVKTSPWNSDCTHTHAHTHTHTHAFTCTCTHTQARAHKRGLQGAVTTAASLSHTAGALPPSLPRAPALRLGGREPRRPALRVPARRSRAARDPIRVGQGPAGGGPVLSRRAEDRHPAMPWLGQPASHGMVGCSASDGATHARAYGPTHTHRHTHTWEHTHTHTWE